MPVRVAAIEPNRVFQRAMSHSIEVEEIAQHLVGYVRIRATTMDTTRRILEYELSNGRLAKADALVLDLRSRWGYGAAELSSIFLDRTPQTKYFRRGQLESVNSSWDKPVVAIIDEGTSAGMELLAHALKANGLDLIGAPTARSVLAAEAFVLPDRSFLLLPVADVVTEGERLVDTGVEPTIPVERDIRYENGEDPQIEAAMARAVELLRETR